MTQEQTENMEVKIETSNPVERAEAVAKRIEEANKKTEELVLRQEKARAHDILSGKANAGEPPMKLEETPAEYKDRVLRGEI